LEKEEEIGILLQFSVIGVVALGWVDIFKGSLDLPLLVTKSSDNEAQQKTKTDLIQSHPILNQQRNPGIQVSHIPLQHEVLF
jgi:hypothetical protein